MKVVELPYFELLDRFGPQTIHVENFDSDLLNEKNERHIWTVVATDNGSVVCSGWHYVNRLSYYIFEKPVPEGEFYVEREDDDDELRSECLPVREAEGSE